VHRIRTLPRQKSGAPEPLRAATPGRRVIMMARTGRPRRRPSAVHDGVVYRQPAEIRTKTVRCRSVIHARIKHSIGKGYTNASGINLTSQVKNPVGKVHPFNRAPAKMVGNVRNRVRPKNGRQYTHSRACDLLLSKLAIVQVGSVDKKTSCPGIADPRPETVARKEEKPARQRTLAERY